MEGLKTEKFFWISLHAGGMDVGLDAPVMRAGLG